MVIHFVFYYITEHIYIDVLVVRAQVKYTQQERKHNHAFGLLVRCVRARVGLFLLFISTRCNFAKTTLI